MEIDIIIPATNKSIILINTSLIKFLNKKKANIAPKGSANPEIKAFVIAFFLLLVA